MNSFSFLLKVLIIKIIGFLILGCSSSYKIPPPKDLNFVSNTSNDSLTLFYKYDLLENKYAKKELKKGYKVVAVKIINDSNKDLTFGKDLVLEYSSGQEVYIMDETLTYKSLKQGSAIYALYLLMTPLNLYTYSTDSNGFSEETSSFPIGLVIGPGLALTNILGSSSANKKFKNQLENHNLMGKQIKSGETTYGIVPIKHISFDALRLKVLSN